MCVCVREREGVSEGEREGERESERGGMGVDLVMTIHHTTYLVSSYSPFSHPNITHVFFLASRMKDVSRLLLLYQHHYYEEL